jgi:C4-type Zn-finger protein
MVKIIDCPLCNGGKLKIQISNGYEVAFNGALKDLPMIVRCKNCNRNVKYKVVEKDKELKQQ